MQSLLSVWQKIMNLFVKNPNPNLVKNASLILEREKDLKSLRMIFGVVSK